MKLETYEKANELIKEIDTQKPKGKETREMLDENTVLIAGTKENPIDWGGASIWYD